MYINWSTTIIVVKYGYRKTVTNVNNYALKHNPNIYVNIIHITYRPKILQIKTKKTTDKYRYTEHKS